jgi:hypothetical protein
MAGSLNGNESAAIIVSTTAPAWFQWLQQINVVLAFVSLILGMSFTIWTWRRAVKKGEADHDDPQNVRDDDYSTGK